MFRLPSAVRMFAHSEPEVTLNRVSRAHLHFFASVADWDDQMMQLADPAYFNRRTRWKPTYA